MVTPEELIDNQEYEGKIMPRWPGTP